MYERLLLPSTDIGACAGCDGQRRDKQGSLTLLQVQLVACLDRILEGDGRGVDVYSTSLFLDALHAGA
jgi:hypothetical protein